MKEIHFTSVLLFLFIFTVITVTGKQWKKDDWEKKHTAPQKGIHYQWPTHPKHSHKEQWKTYHPHHNEKQTKETSKQLHHLLDHHEAKFQSHHKKQNKKHNQKHYDRWEREDLHLQDLNLESQIKKHHHNFRGSHSQHDDGNREVERIIGHTSGHLNKDPWMKHEHNMNTKAFTQIYKDHHHSHHKNHKSSSHHKNHKQGDKSMKNKRKKAHEKKLNKKHHKKHIAW